jgi:SAM-dependent methyltransferase
MQEQPVFTYWSEDNLDVHIDLIRDWQAEFPGFKIFGDRQVLPLLASRFPDYVEVYNDIRIPTAKSDVAMLLLMYEYGGLYVDCHCGIRDADEIRALMALLYDFDCIFVEPRMSKEPRPPDRHQLLNSIMFCRPRLEVMFKACRQALANLARHRAKEYRMASDETDIWLLCGPGLLSAVVFEAASLNYELRREYQGRIKTLREEVAPIVRNRYRKYSDLSTHWSKRQNKEPLFGQATKTSSVGLSEKDIKHALANSKFPGVLEELFDTSRRAFGVQIRHYPYTINYPWALSRLAGLAAGSRLLDIGAGATPVPLYLAEKGMYIDCVDGSDYARVLPAGDDWNEWGFFDYAALHENLTAHNYSIETFTPWQRYDAIYSISTIAHMPSPVREKTLERCSQWLKSGGLLVFAIDLIPNTDTLWNLGGSEETPEEHGTYQDMERQLQSLGFSIIESRIERVVDKWSRTNLYFLVAQKR